MFTVLVPTLSHAHFPPHRSSHCSVIGFHTQLEQYRHSCCMHRYLVSTTVCRIPSKKQFLFSVTMQTPGFQKYAYWPEQDGVVVHAYLQPGTSAGEPSVPGWQQRSFAASANLKPTEESNSRSPIRRALGRMDHLRMGRRDAESALGIRASDVHDLDVN